MKRNLPLVLGALVLLAGLSVALILLADISARVVRDSDRKKPVAWMLTCGPCDRAPQPVTRLVHHEDGSWTFVNASDYAVRTTEMCTAVESPIRK